ncbi:MAG: ATP-binding cassette domain-containing protein, partial [Gammaproteobacteria bacterium]|nr:ATP-binding cassette domain-containing protein [Gammaproteobacteria bacterium]
MSHIECSELTISISEIRVCNNLSFSINSGESWAILGMNGCGKTTLLHTLAGLLPAQSGDISINTASLNNLSRRDIAQQLGLLMQHQ